MKLDDLIKEKFEEAKVAAKEHLTHEYHYVMMNSHLDAVQHEVTNEIKAYLHEMSKPDKLKQYLIAAACFLTGLAIGIII